MNKVRIVVSVSALAVVGATAACASEEVTVSSPSDTVATTSATTAAPTTGPAMSSGGATTSATASVVVNTNCASSELSVSLGAVSGAAGSTEIPIQFSNVGSRTCTLDGYPGVSYVSSPGGAQVGPAATRTGSDMSPVALAPGATATSAVKASVVGNYPADQCQPTSVSGLDVYSPNVTQVVYLPYPTTGCGASDASITQLTVQPVVAS